MARRIEHRATSEWPATRVYDALCDADHLRDRVRELGGHDSDLVKHVVGDHEVRFEMRQGVRAESLPTLARTVVGEDLLIHRSESWRRADEDHCTGEVAAEIEGVPCSITGSMWLRDLVAPEGGQASEFVVDGSVRVSIPFFGGKLEDLVAEQVIRLLTAEGRFTSEWLAKHG